MDLIEAGQRLALQRAAAVTPLKSSQMEQETGITTMSSKLRTLTLGAALLAIGITWVRGRSRGRRSAFKR
jgi:hypothetical protein